ncbi:hypothetical protein [Alteromonas macleodii]|uniref:hypothetical protein n=1 Tax=Alteromonas macleodii TaxID=28108 RepID=UPI0020767974|nr:hypothetical protein [Alteromonas macleodii]USI27913.1 hypothetical protein NFG60_19750 [Alteromonas macleodii]
MKEKTQVYISLVFSIIAISISTSAWYMEWWHVDSKLSMKLIDFGFGKDIKNHPRCTLDIALLNYGNKDSGLLRISLNHSSVESTHNTLKTNGAAFYPEGYHGGFTDIVLNPGKLKRLKLVFKNCTPENLMARTKSQDANVLYLKTESLGYKGDIAHADVLFAITQLSEKDTMKIQLLHEGQFDLMQNGAKVRGYQVQRKSMYTFTINSHGLLDSRYEENTYTPWNE